MEAGQFFPALRRSGKKLAMPEVPRFGLARYCKISDH
jgi:hypothetical protein